MKERTLPFEAFKFPSWIPNPQRATDEYSISRFLDYFDAIRSHLLKVFPPLHFISNISNNEYSIRVFGFK
jgi:hypothetical protein